MWFSMIVKFLAAHWRTIAVAVVAGVIISGVATLWGAYKIEKGTRIGLEAELEAAKVRQATVEASLGECVEANHGWAEAAELWQKRLDEMRRRQDQYRRQLQTLEAAHESIEVENGNLLDQIAAIDSVECEGAVDQLIAALGWGSS